MNENTITTTTKNSPAKIAANARYDKMNTTQFSLKLNKKTDQDIIEQLNSIPFEDGGKQGYIKRLIREDIEKNKRS